MGTYLILLSGYAFPVLIESNFQFSLSLEKACIIVVWGGTNEVHILTPPPNSLVTTTSEKKLKMFYVRNFYKKFFFYKANTIHGCRNSPSCKIGTRVLSIIEFKIFL